MFTKLLIANRGEIACRIMRTAHAMGIATVAVYSEADAHALHVAMAGQAHCIGPAAPRDSYLRGDAILRAARLSGAQAIHPGYGFLSENAEFAEACAEAGVIFVGPPPAAIRAMGGKSESKALMQAAGVPLVPGYHGVAQDLETLGREARQIGYPVLIKASAGGGGKGMRIVQAEAELEAAVAGAKREALSSFGSDRVLIERYLQRPRHVEIQVFADSHGHCVHLFERDCSVQRRHQKVIEEAPAPGMTPAMRAAMGASAIAAARAVGYVGAGTVEFIVEDDRYAFMEMNTRLQVEHPVTEAITGQDLVQWQLLVAAGGALPLSQDQLAIQGHAFEARLYAEDPQRDFLPSVGTLTHLRLPTGVRVDAGVRQGDRIGVDYDPMIAKIIAHGPDRETALRRLAAALSSCEVMGVQTNLALLHAIATAPAFGHGDFDTGFIARHPELLAQRQGASAAAVAACVLAVLEDPANDHDCRSAWDPWSARDAWTLNLEPWRSLTLASADTTWQVTARPAAAGWSLSWAGTTLLAALHPAGIVIDGVLRRVTVLRQPDVIVVIEAMCSHVFTLPDPCAAPAVALAAGGRVTAPIPGRVAGVLVATGDSVTRGQTLVVLEAMKMELTLAAPADGTVKALHCAVGDMVSEGHELVELTPVPTPPPPKVNPLYLLHRSAPKPTQ